MNKKAESLSLSIVGFLLSIFGVNEYLRVFSYGADVSGYSAFQLISVAIESIKNDILSCFRTPSYSEYFYGDYQIEPISLGQKIKKWFNFYPKDIIFILCFLMVIAGTVVSLIALRRIRKETIAESIENGSTYVFIKVIALVGHFLSAFIIILTLTALLMPFFGINLNRL